MRVCLWVALLGACSSPARETGADKPVGTDSADSGAPLGPCTAGTPELVVNHHESGGYHVISDGDTVRLVHGIQGGWHIESAVDVTVLHTDAFMRVTGTDVDTGHTFCTIQTHVRLTGDSDCGGQSPETLCIAEDLGPLEADGTVGEALDGRTVDLTVLVVDAADVSVEQTLTITLDSDP